MTPLSPIEADRFAAAIDVPTAMRPEIAAALANFPAECKSRGMFADGVLKIVARQASAERAREIQTQAGYPRRIMSFSLYPHRDFYRLFYSSARALYPHDSLGDGMRKVAESFYPIFASSLPGRTMAAMLGRSPRKVLERFVDAYNIATPWNEHVVVEQGGDHMIWQCKVEPCPLYPDTFAGICTGMVEGNTGVRPNFEVVSRMRQRDHQNITFRISW